MRKFGFYPDTASMQPGDLILVCPRPKTANTLVIERTQAQRHNDFDAQWIHAAAFLGDDVLTGYRISISALKMFKTSYGFLDLLEVGRRSIFGSSNALSRRSKEAICSDYYNDAVARVPGRGAVSAKINPFTPADLSASANMLDVHVDWRTLQT